VEIFVVPTAPTGSVAAGHPESYAEVVRREVTERLGLDPAKVAVPEGSAADPERAAADYDAAIAAAGGIDV
jgi:glucosamine-6-phosphate deaminase